MPYAILVVTLLVILYVGSFALNRRYIDHSDLDGDHLKKCLACPISGCGIKDRLKEENNG